MDTGSVRAIWERDGYMLRPAQISDAEAYYAQNFDPLDEEAARLTGSKRHFTKEEVVRYFRSCAEDDAARLFLLFSPQGGMIGECAINEIDKRAKSANFRICIFPPAERGRGLGDSVIEAVRDYAFEELKLHRLSLSVFSFNPRAERAYLKAGFRREGVLRDAVLDGGRYADEVLMSLLEEEWRALKGISPCGGETAGVRV